MSLHSTSPSLDLEGAVALLHPKQITTDHELVLTLPQLRIRIQTNTAPLQQKLQHYLAGAQSDPENDNDREEIVIHLIDSTPLSLSLPFQDWAREPGKRGRKDAYYDLPHGRLIRKVRTGMLFLQSSRYRIATGPCLDHLSQVLNFINSQYMNWLQQQGWLIAHAAALTLGSQGIAIAGFSGGGKSTLMLRLLEQEGSRYLTNDRLFLQRSGEQCRGRGIAKWPRVNPGTLLHHPRFHTILSPERRDQLRHLDRESLWQLEEKHDIDIAQCYGQKRIQLQSDLHHLLLLDWDRQSEEPATLTPITLSRQPRLLEAILKSPGPFYQHRDQTFEQDHFSPDRNHYLQTLAPLQCYRVSGRIDFDSITTQLLQRLEGLP